MHDLIRTDTLNTRCVLPVCGGVPHTLEPLARAQDVFTPLEETIAVQCDLNML